MNKRHLSFLYSGLFVAALGLPACEGAGKLGLDLDLDFALEGGQLTIDSFTAIAEATGGKVYSSTGSLDIPDKLLEAMLDGTTPDQAIDIAIVVDTTGSMGDDIEAIRDRLVELIDALAEVQPDYQVAVVEYRDVGDDFEARTGQNLTSDKMAAQGAVASLEVGGGGDWCEHVHAGLSEAINGQSWRAGTVHRVILIGDAPAHEYPDDMRNFQNVVDAAENNDVVIYGVGAYCDDICQGLVAVAGALGADFSCKSGE